jgi:tellurite resistance protein
MPMTDVEILRAACCLAAVDGDIDAGEQELIQQLADKAGVGRASMTAMLDRAKSDHTFFEEQFDLLSREPDRSILTMLKIAMADGQITTEERVVLHHFAQKLKIKDAKFNALLETAESRLKPK